MIDVIVIAWGYDRKAQKNAEVEVMQESQIDARFCVSTELNTNHPLLTERSAALFTVH